MTNKLLYSLMEGIYILYMFNFFKTTWSIHHPLEMLFQNNNYLQHPISSGEYENKICKLGNLTGMFLFFWFILRWKLNENARKKWNKIILIIIATVSLLMNINAFIYLLPIIVIEYYIH